MDGDIFWFTGDQRMQHGYARADIAHVGTADWKPKIVAERQAQPVPRQPDKASAGGRLIFMGVLLKRPFWTRVDVAMHLLS